MLARMLYRTITKNKKMIGKIIRNFWILNKFLSGAKITKNEPARLLTKNRG
jgi:hypothetical protein